MINDLEKAKYLTDAQWLRLMEIVSDNSQMMLTMPVGKSCPADLTFKNTHYVIYSDGSYEWQIV